MCHRCLAAFPPPEVGVAAGSLGLGPVRHGPTGRRFCSDSCLAAATTDWLAVEAAALAAGGEGGPLAQLYAEAAATDERFPLMAVRLALMRVSREARARVRDAAGGGGGGGAAAASATQRVQEPRDSGSAPRREEGEGAAGTEDGEGAGPRPVAADALRGMGVLCYARVGEPPPEPWAQQHAALAAALAALGGDARSLAALAAALGGRAGKGAEERAPAGEEVRAVAAAVRGAAAALSLRWYVDALARLHVNVFQASEDATSPCSPAGCPATGPCKPAAAPDPSPPQPRWAPCTGPWPRKRGLTCSGCLRCPPLAPQRTPSTLHTHCPTTPPRQVHNPLAGLHTSDLAAAASALVSDSAGGASSGSAAYCVASLLNHSCEPSLELAFPAADGVAAFVAARDVALGEEVTISYLDVGLPYGVRQQHLAWSYGFACRCGRCQEEGGGAAGAA